jgi:predicted DNA-binding antitoxin AbrB/MazE fold protein
MTRVIHATYEAGVFRPDTPPDLEPRTRVRLLVDSDTPGDEQPSAAPSEVAGDEIERWLREADRLASQLSDHDEWERFERGLSLADQRAKDAVRREWETA